MRFTIRNKLILFFSLVAIGGVSVFTFPTYFRIKADAVKLAEEKLTTLANTSSSIIQNFIEERKADLKVYSTSSVLIDAVDSGDYTVFSNTLSKFRNEKREIVKEIFFYDANGVIRTSSSRESVGQKVGDLNTFRKWTMGEEDFIFFAFIDRKTATPVFMAATPVRRGGRVVGLLAEYIDIKNLSQMLEDVKYGLTGETYLVDDETGLMLTESLFVEALKKEGFVEETSIFEVDVSNNEVYMKGRELPLDGTVFGQWKGYRDNDVFSVAVNLSNIGMILITEQEESEVLETLYDARTFYLFFSPLLLLVIIFLVYFISRSITKLDIDVLPAGATIFIAAFGIGMGS